MERVGKATLVGLRTVLLYDEEEADILIDKVHLIVSCHPKEGDSPQIECRALPNAARLRLLKMESPFSTASSKAMEIARTVEKQPVLLSVFLTRAGNANRVDLQITFGEPSNE